jgi:hypothetical protein
VPSFPTARDADRMLAGHQPAADLPDEAAFARGGTRRDEDPGGDAARRAPPSRD